MLTLYEAAGDASARSAAPAPASSGPADTATTLLVATVYRGRARPRRSDYRSDGSIRRAASPARPRRVKPPRPSLPAVAVRGLAAQLIDSATLRTDGPPAPLPARPGSCVTRAADPSGTSGIDAAVGCGFQPTGVPTDRRAVPRAAGQTNSGPIAVAEARAAAAAATATATATAEPPSEAERLVCENVGEAVRTPPAPARCTIEVTGVVEGLRRVRLTDPLGATSRGR